MNARPPTTAGEELIPSALGSVAAPQSFLSDGAVTVVSTVSVDMTPERVLPAWN